MLTGGHPFRYTACGLTFASTAPIPSAEPAAVRVGDALAPAVLVHWDGAGLRPQTEHPPDSHVIVESTGGWLAVSPGGLLGPGGTRLRFGHAEHQVQFDIAPDAARVAVTWTPAVLPAHACTLLFSTVLVFLLHRRGRVALHASVLAWDDRAFALAGRPGAGKSTLAAALVQRGAVALSDDVAAVAPTSSGWAVLPGRTGFRLSGATRAALDLRDEVAAPVWPRSPLMSEHPSLDDKAVVVLGEPPGPERLPLAGIFVMPPRADAGVAPAIRPLPAVRAVPHLVEHLLTPAWLESRVDAPRFAAVADLARRTPVRLVERPDSLTALPSLCDAMVAEMDRLHR